MNKQKTTMQEMLKRQGWTLSQMAEKLDCSISLISKIQTGTCPITPNFQEKFQEHFPNFELENDKIKWKEKYEQLEEKYNMARDFLKDYAEMLYYINNDLEYIENTATTMLSTVRVLKKLIPNFQELEAVGIATKERKKQIELELKKGKEVH